MSDPTVVSYQVISGMMRKINEVLLRQQKGVLIRAKVNDKNEVEDIDFVSMQEALNSGFSPAEYVSKPKEPDKTNV